MLSMFFAVLENPNDEPLFEIFYEKYNGLVYHIAYEHVQNKESAEDCTQEVFLQLAKNFHNINRDFDDKSVLNYVRIVSKNIAIDTYRKDKKHSSRVVDTEVSEFLNLKEEDFDIFDEILPLLKKYKIQYLFVTNEYVADTLESHHHKVVLQSNEKYKSYKLFELKK